MARLPCRELERFPASHTTDAHPQDSQNANLWSHKGPVLALATDGESMIAALSGRGVASINWPTEAAPIVGRITAGRMQSLAIPNRTSQPWSRL